MMRKKLISLLLCGVVSATAMAGFAGCFGGNQDSPESSQAEKQTVKLTLWGPTEHQTMLGEMVEAFKAANTDANYEITLGVCSEADAYTKLSTDPSAGADVYAFANDQILNLNRVGALARVGGAALEKMKSENGTGAVNATKIGDGYYAYPYSADNGYFLYYNKSVVKDTSSLEAILEACQGASKKFVYDLDNSWYDAAFFFGTGCTYEVTYTEDGSAEKSITCDFDDATKGVAAGKAMINLAAAPAFLNGDDAVLKAGFADGSVAAAVSGTWNAKDIQGYLGENYAACALPTFTVDGKTYQMSSFAGYKLYGVNPHSEALAEAHKLAAFLSGEAMQQKRFETFEIGPSNTKVASSEAVQANVALAALAAQGAYAVAQTAVPNGFWGAVETFGKEVCAKTVTLENLQAKLTTMGNSIRSVANS